MIKTTGEFQAVFGAIMQNAIEEVIEKAFDALKSEVESVVYDKGGSDWYERSNTFLDQWYTETTNAKGRVRGAMIKNNTSLMANDPSDFVHGSNVAPQWRDFRSKLTEAIFNGYQVFNSGYHVEARNAWSSFEEKVNEEKIGAWFKAAMRRQGVTIG